MIFDEIVVHNFGVFRGRQSIKLTPESPKKPIILFGGLNGGGKTTLLDAFQLSLYGKASHCSNRGLLSYDEFLRRCIHRTSSTSEGAALELQFRHFTDGTEQRFRIHRSWSASGNSIKERIEVVRNDHLDEVLTDSWNEHVDEFMPNRLAHLFFFDGEKIEGLADFEKSAELLSSAIHSLLGLDIVDRLTADLTVLERKKRTALKTDADRIAIERAEAEVERLERSHKDLTEMRGAAQNDLDRLQKRLHTVESQFRTEGGDLYERRSEIERDRNIVKEQVLARDEEMRVAASGAAPLLLVIDLLKEVSKQDHRELAAAEAAVLGEVLEARDAATLRILRDLKIDANSMTELKTFLSNDRRQRGKHIAQDAFLKLSPDIRERLRTLIGEDLPEARLSIQRILQSSSEFHQKYEDLERKLAGVPDHEAIAKLIEELKAARESVELARARVAALDLDREKIARELELKRNTLNVQIEKTADLKVEKDDTARIIVYSKKVQETLAGFRKKVLLRHVSHIEHLILDSFQQLLRKESLVKSLRINPERFTIELLNPEGKVVVPDRLSAGERQLLALSILWGLARASGRPLPTIIDTPLGRLDATHRDKLVERYFPNASHQVILLSTDKEIDKELYSRLEPFVGRSFTLQFNDKDASTSVKPGYFW